jgi:PAS domain S-box-containing protein
MSARKCYAYNYMPDKTKQHQGLPTFSITSSFIIWLSLLLPLASMVLYFMLFQSTDDLQFSPYAVLSFLPLAINIFIIVLIKRLRTRSEESVWFVLYLAAVSIACFGEGMQRLSTTPDMALYWYQLNGIGYALIPLAYYLFVFSYVRPLRLQSPLLIPSILCGAVFMLFYFVSTNLILSYDVDKLVLNPWGYTLPSGPGFLIFVVWLESLLVTAVVTLFRFGRKTTNTLERQQAKIYIWAVLIPLVGGTITDALMPAIGVNDVLPTSMFLSTCTSIVAYYGLRRFRSFQVNPAEFAGNVVRTMQEAVIVTKEDSTITFVNKEAERLLGLPASEILGSTLKSRFDEATWQLIRKSDESAEDIPVNTVDRLRLKDAHNQRVPVRVQVSAVEATSPAGEYVFVIADISDITQSYHKLQESAVRIGVQKDELEENQVTMQRLLDEAKSLQVQLEDEKENIEHTVEVRTAELREARDKIEASDKLKSEFIMLSSHNLRTPLTIMGTSMELLQASRDNLTDGQKKTFEILSSSIEQLSGFVEDLLTISTLEAGDELSRVPVQVGKIIAPLIDETRDIAMAKNLAFYDDISAGDALIDANEMRLRGAVRNLLHNAVKFTQSGDIRLTVTADETTVRLAVQDTGIGISTEELPHLFEKFHRGTSTLVYDYQGVGIGLYLSKLVVTEHGGTVNVDSTEGSGSTFTIELPRSTAAEQQQSAS